MKTVFEQLPIISKISFHKVYELLLDVVKKGKKYESNYAKALLKKFDDHPELKEGTVNLNLLNEEKEFISEVMSLLFPSALTLNEIKGATAPFQFDFFYTSERMKSILEAAGEDFAIELKGLDEDLMFIMACSTILQGYYHFQVKLNNPMIFEIPNKKTQKVHFYRSAFNADLLEIIPNENAVEITEDIYFELLDNFENIAIWKKYFPTGSWTIKGLGLVNLLDVTVDQSLNHLTTNLLSGHQNALEQIGDNLNTLLNCENLRIAYIGYEQNKFMDVAKKTSDNILLDEKAIRNPEDTLCDRGVGLLLKEKKPFILSDAEAYAKKAKNYLAEKLIQNGIKSYILSPLLHEGELIGILELGSTQKRELNTLIHERLRLALPILSMAANRFREEYRVRIDAIIQEQCTSIHPSVKWRFEEQAKDILADLETGKNSQFSDLLFPDIYPLYGQLDIKGSSVKRNDAVLHDLSSQLAEVNEILELAIANEPLSAYEEMQFRISRFLKEFEIGLFEGSETEVLRFLQNDIYPAFDYLKEMSPNLKEKIEAYMSHINSKTGMVYQERKDFDESVGIINTHLARYIDGKQIEAQKTFPHFFERYNTDGVEFNMYIGQSISREKKFNQVYLDNLYLWQLKTMCEMEREVHALNKTMPMKLEVASLILLFNHTLSIKFRVDEKRFDVDGAYNARYEIVKKRIDKAHIKNSNERITQPGKIAIIYSRKEEAQAYKKHLDYMEARGYLIAESLEDHELEDLQGITGLRALRVSLTYTDSVENAGIENLEKQVKNG